MLPLDTIQKNLENLKREIEKYSTKELTVIAVTKTHPVGIWQRCIDLGLYHIGENRVQELKQKSEEQPDLRKKLFAHLIGPVQRNKIKYLPGLIDSLDTIDSVVMVEQLDQRWDNPKKLPVLLQINSTDEMQKSGIHWNDRELLNKVIVQIKNSAHIQLEGLMTMGPTPREGETIENNEYRKNTGNAFQRAYKLKSDLEKEFSLTLPRLSMGMTHDFPVAIENGATEIRVGSLLFGNR